MDEALLARDEMRSYALRRCIRFYAAAVILAVAAVGHAIVQALGGLGDDVAAVAACIFATVAAVEAASTVVMHRIARVRDRSPGPEDGLWRFAQGPYPGWIATALWVALAAVWAVVAR